MRNKQMSGSVKCGKPKTVLINHVMHASKKELRQMLISFITSEPMPMGWGEPIKLTKRYILTKEDGKEYDLTPYIIEADEDTDIEFAEQKEVKAQRPDVDNAHNIAAEIAKPYKSTIETRDENGIEHKFAIYFIEESDDSALQENDLTAVRKIKEKHPERLTMAYSREIYRDATQACQYTPKDNIIKTYDAINKEYVDIYNRLAGIEDIIYGEGEEK